MRTSGSSDVHAGFATSRGALLARLAALSGAGTTVSVVVVAVHDLRRVAGALGARAARHLLEQLALRLHGLVGPAGEVALVAPTELGVLLVHRADHDDVDEILRRVRAEVCEPLQVGDDTIVLRVAIGLTTLRHRAADVEDVLAHAEAAADTALPSLRPTPASYGLRAPAEDTRTSRLGARLESAARNGELSARYQPIVSLQDEGIVGFEALVRWVHPELGAITAEECVRVAEQLDLIGDLDAWVLREACASMVSWGDVAPRRISVNLSASNLHDAGLAGRVASVASELGLSTSRMRLEITETAFMRDTRASLRVMAELRELGVTFAMDDFGTGYSSLLQLIDLPLEVLKLDGSFIRRLEGAPRGRGVVATVVSMAHDLGMVVVAECVETPKQRDLLREIHCDCAQGYLFARPLSSGEALTLLDT